MKRVALVGGLLCTGLVVGVASVAVHNTWWGLPLALAATAATAYALPGGWTRRAPFVLGWSAVVAALALPRPEGDFVIAGDVNGYVLLGFGLVLLVAGLVTLPPPRPGTPVDTSSSTPTS
ncbi:MAG: DUF6113 family protein [Actinomycetota bacterium]|nr:DUF6113 family protein [Actinomycetota bacterium]